MSWKELFFGSVPVAVAKSLSDEPEAWSSDAKLMGHPYTLEHKSGVVLWTANDTYGMQVYGDFYRKVRAWGGVSLLSSIGLSPGHHFLRRAANRWIRENVTQPRHLDVVAALRT